jgi:hypothetical protein
LRYFVIAPDGSKYGPADFNTLRAWVNEGRISADTILEEESSRQRIAARLVAGLIFMEGPGYPHASAMRNPRMETGRKPGPDFNILLSYACSVMSILCCTFFIFGSFIYANKAIANGSPGGKAAKVVAYIFLLLAIISSILEVMFFKQLSAYLTSLAGGGGGMGADPSAGSGLQ